MKKIKFLTAIVALGAIATTVPALVSCSCGKKDPEAELEINDDYVNNERVKGYTEELGALQGASYVKGFIINKPEVLPNLKVEVTNIKGFEGTVTAEPIQIYDQVFGVILYFNSTQDYLVLQKPTFDLQFKFNDSIVKESKDYDVAFSTDVISIENSIKWEQKFVIPENQSETSFVLNGHFYCKNVLDKTIKDVENFYIESSETLPGTAKFEFSIINLKSDLGHCYIKCDLTNFTQDIENHNIKLTVRNKVFPGWSEDIDIKLTFKVSQDVNEMFDFKQIKDKEEASIVRCHSLAKEITIPDTCKITGVENELPITHINMESFENLIGLEKVNIGQNVTYIGQWAFENCVALDNLVIPKNVNKIFAKPFKNCININNVEVEEGNQTYTTVGPDGNKYAAIFEIDGEKRILQTAFNLTTIPDKLEQIGPSAFSYSRIKEITIPNTVTLINAGAFSHCFNLTTVNFEAGSKLTNLGSNVFSHCKELTTIELPETVTSMQWGIFEYCNSLKTITLPSKVERVEERLFAECESLEEVTLPKEMVFLKSNVFDGCSSLKKIIIPAECGWYTSKDADGNEYGCVMSSSRDKIIFGGSESKILSSIKKIDDGAFQDRQLLTKIELPDSVTQIGKNAFARCYYLEEIKLSNNLTSIGESAFNSCLSLTTIELPSTLVNIYNNAFDSCYYLETITGLGANIKKIGDYCFNACVSLTTITLEACITLTEFGKSVFSNCYYLETISFPNSFDIVPEKCFENCYSLRDFNCSNLRQIAESAFTNCTSLTAITLPTTFDFLGDNAFRGCTSLKTFELENNDNLVYIHSNTFQNCTSLEKVVLPNKLTQIYWSAFKGCTSLKTIDLPDTLETIGDNAFAETGLESIVLPLTIKNIGHSAFQNCTQLQTVTIKGKIEKIEYSVFQSCTSLSTITFDDASALTEIGEQAFTNCQSLTQIDINTSQLTSIPEEAFRNCLSLTTVKLPSTITKIENNAFSFCVALESVNFSELTLLKTIDEYAFCYCSKLNNVTIPATVESIGLGAFSYCESLTSATFANIQNWKYLTGEAVDVSDATKAATVLTDGYYIFVYSE